MKKWMNKYSRTCRASLMLLLVYSSHLISFHSLLANPGQFLTGIIGNKATSTWPKKHTDCLLLLSKHQLVKHSNEGEGCLSLSGPVEIERVRFQYFNIAVLNKAVQNRSDDSYRLYCMLSTFLI